jgi:hypothetical protein
MVLCQVGNEPIPDGIEDWTSRHKALATERWVIVDLMKESVG